MARLTTGQRCGLVMKFLNGFRNPRVALPLASYGFGQATLDEGWTLLRAVVGETFSVPVRVPPPDPTLLARLDAWENRWLKVAEATLRRHYPDIAERVFLNLSRTTGIEVVASVTTFLDRVEPLADGDEAEKSARALLAERGLTDEVVAEAKEIVQAIGTIATAPMPTMDREAIAEAEAAMWAWYREWVTIARIAIPDGRALRSIGLGTKRSKKVDEDGGEDDLVDDDLGDDEDPVIDAPPPN